jgi:hypothetical protein
VSIGGRETRSSSATHRVKLMLTPQLASETGVGFAREARPPAW